MARRETPLVLATMAIAALAIATVTFTNITYWDVYAIKPQVVKYAGEDAKTPFINVSSYIDPNTGYNITRISVVAPVGDPTTYDDVLRVCNKYDKTMTLELRYIGMLTGPYTQYIRSFQVFWADNPSQYVGVDYGNVVPGPVSTVVQPGQCKIIGVRLVIDGRLYQDHPHVVNGKMLLATYEVHIDQTPHG